MEGDGCIWSYAPVTSATAQRFKKKITGDSSCENPIRREQRGTDVGRIGEKIRRAQRQEVRQ